jgi:hypothetical protein
MTQPDEATDLQFDRADFSGTPAIPACAACQQPIVDRYFDVNGQMTCASCHETIAKALGSQPGRLAPFIALGAGLAGGLVGALLYYAVLAISGYEIGLIAIAVGLLVGRAVRWGSGGRGGRGYQVMAVAITYVAIVSTYVPFILTGLRQPPVEQTTPATTSAQPDTAQTPSPAIEATDASSSASSRAADAARAPGDTIDAGGAGDAGEEERPSLFFVLGFLFLLTMASPFLGGFQNVIGWLIIGFALWEAWKSNRRLAVAISGPFALGATAAADGVTGPPPLPDMPPVPPALPSPDSPSGPPPAPAAS